MPKLSSRRLNAVPATHRCNQLGADIEPIKLGVGADTEPTTFHARADTEPYFGVHGTLAAGALRFRVGVLGVIDVFGAGALFQATTEVSEPRPPGLALALLAALGQPAG